MCDVETMEFNEKKVFNNSFSTLARKALTTERDDVISCLKNLSQHFHLVGWCEVESAVLPLHIFHSKFNPAVNIDN